MFSESNWDGGNKKKLKLQLKDFLEPSLLQYSKNMVFIFKQNYLKISVASEARFYIGIQYMQHFFA